MVDIGVIGCGHMGSAFIAGLAGSDQYEVIACDHTAESLAAVEDSVAQTTLDPSDAAAASIIVLTVKPSDIATVLADLSLSPDQTVVSFAAGISRKTIQQLTTAQVVRVMPNLAAEYGLMAAAATEEGLTDEVRALLDTVGEFVEIDEAQMHIATAVNGSGPAFVFYLIQAFQQAGIEQGLSPQAARVLAAQTFKGAAETVVRSEADLDELIDAVCSPNGTTIEGMNVLWDSTVQAYIADAILAAEQRSRELAAEE